MRNIVSFGQCLIKQSLALHPQYSNPHLRQYQTLCRSFHTASSTNKFLRISSLVLNNSACHSRTSTSNHSVVHQHCNEVHTTARDGVSHLGSEGNSSEIYSALYKISPYMKKGTACYSLNCPVCKKGTLHVNKDTGN